MLTLCQDTDAPGTGSQLYPNPGATPETLRASLKMLTVNLGLHVVKMSSNIPLSWYLSFLSSTSYEHFVVPYCVLPEILYGVTRVELHLPPPLTQHIATMTGCPVIVHWGLSGMSWPEYLQGYAGLGILQTLFGLIRAARMAGENRCTCQ